LPRHRDGGELTPDSGSKRPDPKDAKVLLAEKFEGVCLVRIIKRIHGCRGWTIERSNQRKRAPFSHTSDSVALWFDGVQLNGND
jgi:hypothetical protein